MRNPIRIVTQRREDGIDYISVATQETSVERIGAVVAKLGKVIDRVLFPDLVQFPLKDKH